MPEYHFDVNENGALTVDDTGLSLEGVAAAQREATLALCELAVETLPGTSHGELSIDVRLKNGTRVLTARIVFDAEQGAPAPSDPLPEG